MKQLTAISLLLSLFLFACTSPDGTYLVYKSLPSSYSNALDMNLIKKYGSNRYKLSFTDRYVSFTEIESKQSLVLAKLDKSVPGEDLYIGNTMEGSDSVQVHYELSVTSKSTVFTISARRKNFRSPIGADASVDFYLAKAKSGN